MYFLNNRQNQPTYTMLYGVVACLGWKSQWPLGVGNDLRPVDNQAIDLCDMRRKIYEKDAIWFYPD